MTGVKIAAHWRAPSKRGQRYGVQGLAVMGCRADERDGQAWEEERRRPGAGIGGENGAVGDMDG